MAKKPPLPLEADLQKTIVAYCYASLKPSVMFWHCPNGEKRGIKTGKKLKAMGVLKGVPDLQFMWVDDAGLPQTIFIEVKRSASEEPRASQIEFAEKSPYPCHVVHSLDMVIDIAKIYKLTRWAL